MTELKSNYVVFAVIVACITVHSFKQLNTGNGNKPGQKITTAEAGAQEKQQVIPADK